MQRPGMSTSDPLPEAMSLTRSAAAAGVPLRLLGGLGIRVLCPDFPPRLRDGQDIDFACLSKGRAKVASHLEEHGCEPDRRFNNLNGDRQMYFTAPSGRPIDVIVDRLVMCHTLDFRPAFSRLPLTLDAADLLLSKLQIVQLNEKDAHDIVHLLSGVPVGGDDVPSIGTGRFGQVVAGDWGWWRTVTGNLHRLPALIAGQPDLVPPRPRYDPVAQSRVLLDVADAVPKTVKWRLRANIGDRVRWYELPEEVDH
jgi:hypothetical protein